LPLISTTEVDQLYLDNDWLRKKSDYDGSKRDEREARRCAAIGLASCLRANATAGGHRSTRTVPTPAQVPVPVQTSAAEPAPADHIVNIQRANCADLLKLSPEDRAAASMFYIGYQASRFRARTINVGVIPSIEGQAIASCEENPDRTVAHVFAKAYLQTRR
jgi:HdeA/HdeB family